MNFRVWIRGVLTLTVVFGGCLDSTEGKLVDDAGMDADDWPDDWHSCDGDEPDRGELPCRPSGLETSATDAITLTYAVKEFFLDQSQKKKPAGLDLDGIDSTNSSPSPGIGECTAVHGVDAAHGIDNSFGINLWPSIGDLLRLECEAEAAHRRGLGTLLIHVMRWNGQEHDAQVDAFIVPAVLGTYQPSWLPADAAAARASWTWAMEPVDVALQDDAKDTVDLPYAELGDAQRPPAPCWSDSAPGTDWFFANPAAFDELGHPLVRSTAAYISHDWLVIPLPDDAPVDLYSDRRGLQLGIRQGHLLAKLAADRNGFERAFIAGRIPVTDLDAASPGLGFCTNQDRAKRDPNRY
jgi:hypothetical protein